MLIFTCIFAVVFVFAVQGSSEFDLVLDACPFGNIYEKGISASGVPCLIYAHNENIKNDTSGLPMGADLENMVFKYKRSEGKVSAASKACKLDAHILLSEDSSYYIHYHQYQHQCQYHHPYPHQYQYQCSCQCRYKCRCYCQYEHQRLRRTRGPDQNTYQYQTQYQYPTGYQYQTQYQYQYPSQYEYEYETQYQYKYAGQQIYRYQYQYQYPPHLSMDDGQNSSIAWSSSGDINCKRIEKDVDENIAK